MFYPVTLAACTFDIWWWYHTTSISTSSRAVIVKESQAARECKPCVNGDTSFQWEVLWLSAFFRQYAWRSDPSTDCHAKWLKQRGFRQGCAFWSKNRNFLYHL